VKSMYSTTTMTIYMLDEEIHARGRDMDTNVKIVKKTQKGYADAGTLA
jgi:hypothetical protein